MTAVRPIPESYWVIPGRFLAGEYPGSHVAGTARRRVEAFLQAGFNAFFDLTNPHELVPYESILYETARMHDIQVSYQRLSIRDGGVPTVETMKTILDRVDSALDNGSKIYVHCWGGVGRTGTVVGCYLVRHGLTGWQALDQIADWWQRVPKRLFHTRSPETDEQAEWILNWKE